MIFLAHIHHFVYGRKIISIFETIKKQRVSLWNKSIKPVGFHCGLAHGQRRYCLRTIRELRQRVFEMIEQWFENGRICHSKCIFLWFCWQFFETFFFKFCFNVRCNSILSEIKYFLIIPKTKQTANSPSRRPVQDKNWTLFYMLETRCFVNISNILKCRKFPKGALWCKNIRKKLSKCQKTTNGDA